MIFVEVIEECGEEFKVGPASYSSTIHIRYRAYAMIFAELCEEYGEEFCSGTCLIFQYDSYQVQSIRHVFC
jgi:hypothetical protein